MSAKALVKSSKRTPKSAQPPKLLGAQAKAGTSGAVYGYVNLAESNPSRAIEVAADNFGMTKVQFAITAGLGRQVAYKATRLSSPKTQMRIQEMLEIISRVSKWAGGDNQAMAWYRSEPIPAFGDRTAESLVKSGHAAAVRDYLDHIAMGGFA